MSSATPLSTTSRARGASRPDAWLGTIGDELRIIGQVEHVAAGLDGRQRYLVRDEASGNLVEWTSPRRYGIAVGERLRMSGVVRRHTQRGDARVTVLHHCYNPMRLS